MLGLLAISIISWTIIIQHGKYLRFIKVALDTFENKFWNSRDLTSLYTNYQQQDDSKSGLQKVFVAGFKEYIRVGASKNMSLTTDWINNVQRAMRVAHTEDLNRYEKHLNFLATVGSTSPYIGLFGTVWGMMHALQSLGNAKQMTIAMVAPGISEALIATALGLFCAIPAVIAYNRFAEIVSKIDQQYLMFQEEFSNLLSRQVPTLS